MVVGEEKHVNNLRELPLTSVGTSREEEYRKRKLEDMKIDFTHLAIKT